MSLIFQNFCSACDEMYHKHPRRSCHMRKSLRRLEDKGYSSPKVGQPGGAGPVAPPRSLRRSKTGLGGLVSGEPSPAPSRTGTLGRKPSSASQSGGNPMAGRPLPPPPPVGPRASPRASPPPPALPRKSASVSQMTSQGTSRGFPPSSQRQPGIPQPSDQRRHHQTQSAHFPQKSQPLYPALSPGGEILIKIQMLTRPSSSGGNIPYPAASQVNPYPHGSEWNNGGNNYLDEMRFVSKVS